MHQSGDVQTCITHPRVAVVVLNYNGVEDTVECIDSVLNSKSGAHVILVDNGSTDGSYETLRSIFPEVSILRKNWNSGFAGGLNDGIRMAMRDGFDYVLLLNNDTVLEPGLLRELLDFAFEQGVACVVGPRIVLYANPSIPQFDWQNATTTPTVRYDLSGAALLVNIQVIRKVGLFDTTFFCYWEDGDFLERCRKAGLQAIYLPTRASVLHKVQATASKVNGLFAYHMIRNGFLFTRRHGKTISLLKHLFTSLSWSMQPNLLPSERVGYIKGLKDGVLLFLRNPPPTSLSHQ